MGFKFQKEQQPYIIHIQSKSNQFFKHNKQNKFKMDQPFGRAAAFFVTSFLLGVFVIYAKSKDKHYVVVQPHLLIPCPLTA